MYTRIRAWMRFGRGRLEAFNSVNIVPCGQGIVLFLKQEPRTWGAERENFGPLPSKCSAQVSAQVAQVSAQVAQISAQVSVKFTLETSIIETEITTCWI